MKAVFLTYLGRPVAPIQPDTSPATDRCVTEQDCDWEPWCWIEGRCKRESPERGNEITPTPVALKPE